MSGIPVVCAACHEKVSDGGEWEAAIRAQMDRETHAGELGYRAGWERALLSVKSWADGENWSAKLAELIVDLRREGPTPLDMTLDLERIEGDL